MGGCVFRFLEYGVLRVVLVCSNRNGFHTVDSRSLRFCLSAHICALFLSFSLLAVVCFNSGQIAPGFLELAGTNTKSLIPIYQSRLAQFLYSDKERALSI